MSIRHIAWAFDQDLKSGPKFVLVALANYADETGWCYPKQERIAADVGQGVSTVRAHLSDLEELGYIERRERRRQDGTRDSDGYQLLAPEFVPSRRRRATRQNSAVDSEVPPAESRRQNPAVDNRQISANQPPDFSTPYKDEPSDEPSVATTTAPLYPPAGSQPVEGETDSSAPAATPAPITPPPAGEDLSLEAIAARAGMTTDELHAATQRIITAANRAQRRNPHIDQSSLRPLPDSGPSRQEVYGWLTEGIPVETIVEAVQEVASQYRPDGYRRQISTMTYFSARVREKNELRLADEAEGYDDQRRAHRDDRRGVSAEGRRGREAPGRRRVSKYDEFTIRSAGEVA